MIIMSIRRASVFLLVLGVFALLSIGCASWDRMTGKLDMADARIEETSPPEYEGRLRAVAKIGSMTSLEFEDGKYFDVSQATPGLQAGDLVRIFKSKDGLQARLWQPAQAPALNPEQAPPVRRGS